MTRDMQEGHGRRLQTPPRQRQSLATAVMKASLLLLLAILGCHNVVRAQEDLPFPANTPVSPTDPAVSFLVDDGTSTDALPQDDAATEFARLYTDPLELCIGGLFRKTSLRQGLVFGVVRTFLETSISDYVGPEISNVHLQGKVTSGYTTGSGGATVEAELCYLIDLSLDVTSDSVALIAEIGKPELTAIVVELLQGPTNDVVKTEMADMGIEVESFYVKDALMEVQEELAPLEAGSFSLQQVQDPADPIDTVEPTAPPVPTISPAPTGPPVEDPLVDEPERPKEEHDWLMSPAPSYSGMYGKGKGKGDDKKSKAEEQDCEEEEEEEEVYYSDKQKEKEGKGGEKKKKKKYKCRLQEAKTVDEKIRKYYGPPVATFAPHTSQPTLEAPAAPPAQAPTVTKQANLRPVYERLANPIDSSGSTPPTSATPAAEMVGSPANPTDQTPVEMPVAFSPSASPVELVRDPPIPTATSTSSVVASGELPVNEPTSFPTVAIAGRTKGTVLPTVSPPEDSTSGPTQAPSKGVVEPSFLWVGSNQLLLSTLGMFDPANQEQTFFDLTKEELLEYLKENIGDMLQKFRLEITFLKAETRTEKSGMLSSFLRVSYDAEISSLDPSDLEDFTRAKATKILYDFFETRASFQNLRKRYVVAGVNIQVIRVIDKVPPKPVVDEETTSEEGVGVQDDAASRDVEEGKSLAGPIAAILSGVVVLVAVLFLLLNNQRRKRLRRVAMNLFSDERSSDTSEYTSSTRKSGIPSNKIQQSALQLRLQREETARVAAGGRSMSDSTSTFQPGYLEPVPECDGSFERTWAEIDNDSQMEETSLVRLEQGSNLVVSSALLTSLDSTIPMDGLAEQYPEFDAYANIPPSPIWSVDGVSHMSPTDRDEEESYQSQRRRWQDEANDIALIAIPDGSQDYDNQSTSSGSQKSTYSRNIRPKRRPPDPSEFTEIPLD